MLPRLSSFYALNPSLCLSIETVSGEVVDTSGDCDAYVLYLRDGLDGRPLTVLFDEYLVPVCAPKLGDGQLPPRSLKALGEHALIHGSTARHEWNLWLQAQGIHEPVRCSQGPSFEDDFLLVRAALTSQGLALVPEFSVEEELREGKLQVALEKTWPARFAYYAVTLPETLNRPEVRDVLGWLVEQATDVPMPVLASS